MPNVCQHLMYISAWLLLIVLVVLLAGIGAVPTVMTIPGFVSL